MNASRIDPMEAIHEITNGGADFAIDAIGVKVTNEQILPATRGGGPGADNHGGMAILIGLPGWDISIDSRLFVSHQRQYRGSLGATYTDKDFPMFLRWHREGKFPLDKLVTRRYQLDDINEADSPFQGLVERYRQGFGHHVIGFQYPGANEAHPEGTPVH